jgi:hypothetical protein
MMTINFFFLYMLIFHVNKDHNHIYDDNQFFRTSLCSKIMSMMTIKFFLYMLIIHVNKDYNHDHNCTKGGEWDHDMGLPSPIEFSQNFLKMQKTH